MTETPQAHSPIGASSMYRWAACPGSVRLSSGIAQKSSVYAEEGSDAHALAARCALRGESPLDFVGKTVHIDDRRFEVTQEMAEAVAVYTNEIRMLTAEAVGGEVHIERSFDLSAVYPGCFGTADAVIWAPAAKTLTVVDYKHGAGIAVDVEHNPQLQYYGLGALLSCGYPAENVRLVVVQPRCEHPAGPVRAWVISAVDLIDFRADLIEFARATEDPNAPLAPGDHCRFCPAAQINPATMDVFCDALTERRKEVAVMEFSPALSYDPEKLRKALDSREVVKAWLKALDEFAYAEAEAGRCPPGYKLVAKRATRKWRDEGETVDVLQNTFGHDEVANMFKPRELRSPAQLEQHLVALESFMPELKTKAKRAAAAKELLDDFIVAESSGHTLAPETDKRPPVKPEALAEFGDDPLAIPSFLRRDDANTKSDGKVADIFND